MSDDEKPVEGEFVEKPDAQERALALAQERAVGLVRDPDVVLAEAHKAAAALTKVINSKPRKVVLNGKQYLEVEDWVLLGEFYGVAPRVEWTKQITVDGAKGWEARAVVVNKATGVEVGAAEAMCLDNERNWKGRDSYAIRSMAQTRAISKALAGRLRWIPVLAGYAGTPAEEVGGGAGETSDTPDVGQFVPEKVMVKKVGADKQKYVIYSKHGMVFETWSRSEADMAKKAAADGSTLEVRYRKTRFGNEIERDEGLSLLESPDPSSPPSEMSATDTSTPKASATEKR